MSRFSARDITMTAVFAALAVVAAMLVRYGGSIVPFSLMPFVVMLAGAVLGARLGALSMIVYILLGLVGVPVFASPPFGGPAYVLSPTFGFLPGFVGSAYVIGLLLKNREQSGLSRLFLFNGCRHSCLLPVRPVLSLRYLKLLPGPDCFSSQSFVLLVLSHLSCLTCLRRQLPL